MVYNNIKKLRDRIDEGPIPLAQRKPQPKKKREETTPVGTSNQSTPVSDNRRKASSYKDKEDDWYYR